MLTHSKNELRKADDAIIRMTQAKDFRDYEEAWTEFLGAIEKSWNKAERECQSFRNKFEPWQVQYNNERKNDPLLKYIKHARDADEHSIQELISLRPASITIDAATPGGVLDAKSISTDANGNLTIEPGKSPIKVSRHAPTINAKVFINRGVTYNLPTSHRGIPIVHNTNPVSLAILSIAYYRSFLKEVENKFFAAS